MDAPRRTTDNDFAPFEPKVLEVVSVDTEEVMVTIGPRRITGLVSVTVKLENEARSARVYQDAAKRR